MLAPSCLGDDLRADQESDLDADSGETDAGAARLGAGRDVVVARQLASAHTGAIVHGGERRRGAGAASPAVRGRPIALKKFSSPAGDTSHSITSSSSVSLMISCLTS